ncbi:MULTISPECIES: ABC transporter substrate-binding protein [Pseudoalteromonas]|jgi:polar amino acid transport system substrate-binding protein|uniref:substrate-binding periplasmic protein n=1 Tax=Pseudoalteromonas TaxID=53246 RepID=UPI0007835CC5|nr:MULTISPECIES: transporter substrate-binding domain-containing protein [Pseudoalteromonas]MCF7518040.1 transporter substrate-binding domain-containing protein [Pseudoalteromonas sp. L21]UJX27771.1 transporter substrate-binding domain-containing protein [Pseudoalteromonas sp. CF6-2]|tara:strand:- start:5829 stop:6527 length:699 start_codon:yes stop_codon:yes gene_type:complete
MLKPIILSLALLLQPCFAAITVVTENLPSFQYQNAQGVLVGTVVEEVTTALKKSGVEYTLSVNAWPISYNAALRDEKTCIFSIARLPSREDKFSWIAKLGNFTASFYSFKSQQVQIENLEQAKKYRIAVLKDNYSHVYLSEHGFNEQNQLILLDSFENIYDVLKSRRSSIDMVVLSDEQFNYELKKDKTLSLLKAIYKIPADYQDLYFACNKNLESTTLEKLTHAFSSNQAK